MLIYLAGVRVCFLLDHWKKESSLEQSFFYLLLFVYLCALCIVLVFAFSRRRKIVPITLAEFQKAVEDMGHTVSDISANYAACPYIEQCVAICEGNLYIAFFQMDTVDNATAFFHTIKPSIEKEKGNATAEFSVRTRSRCKYRLKTRSAYYMVEQVGATAIYAYSAAADAEKPDQVVKAIGY